MSSLLLLCLVYYAVLPFLHWAIWDAVWSGSSRESCHSEGACWVFVTQNIELFTYGFYPSEHRWRIHGVGLGWALSLLALRYVPTWTLRAWLALWIGTLLPYLSWKLLLGGVWLPSVETSQWGGIFLTLVIAVIGIATSLPLGILLALGRRSQWLSLRLFATLFIEVWRGVPLITVLFMSSVMFPLFFPEEWVVDKLLRALMAVALFSSAYMAEVIRGGLQAVPRGQLEAASTLGLSSVQSTVLIVLPQAIQKVVPAILNSFIALFKDTTLVSIIGMFDILGVVQSASAHPDWLGYSLEGYLFVGFFYWSLCFAMSRSSKRLERQAS
ncbi:MAG: amino acid ABC transporter permease [Zetaproteobacteria bacterium]|nr:amino acid ABC transporter permease [Zetaproteobacteria bacterium]